MGIRDAVAPDGVVDVLGDDGITDGSLDKDMDEIDGKSTFAVQLTQLVVEEVGHLSCAAVLLVEYRRCSGSGMRHDEC